MGAFAELRKVNCNDRVEKKKTGSTELTYLSWTYAFDEVFKTYEDTHYEVWRDPNTHLPYVYDELTGYMVFTSITIEGVTREMWLPVMDSHNAAMKSEPYEVQTKYSKYQVAACSMTDINKTIMRCLVKNLAMFGLGLYIYAGEDLPEGEEEPKQEPKKDAEKSAKQKVIEYITRHNMDSEKVVQICNLYGVKKLSELNEQHCLHYIAALEKSGKNINE